VGLWRYGYRQEAARLAVGILEAAELFHHRLPEAFAGYARAVTKYPVEYPTACSPQAWATARRCCCLRIVLGLDPLGDHLIIDPPFLMRSASCSCWTSRAAGPHGRIRPRPPPDLRRRLA
jgi:glycogen debranching enzyme